MTDDGAVQPSFPFWKARFGAECVAHVVQGTLTSRAPKYSIILELDRKVRDMELPAYAQGSPPQGAGLAQTMSHFMPTNYRELTLLYIHRCFFAHAITSHPTDPIRSQYAPSFLAGYRSACTIIGSVRKQFDLFPAQIARFWVLWTHAFSAAVMLSSVVTHSSQSKVAPAALLELTAAHELFQQASSFGGRAARFLPIIQRLHAKAQKVFFDTHNGIPPSIPGDIFRPSPPGGEPNDELSIFGGKTHTVAAKSNSVPRSHSNTATGSSSSSGSPRSVIDSPPGQAFIPVDNPSFAGAHHSLVNELRGFDGRIAAQIQSAYAPNGIAAARPEVVQQEESPRRRMQREQAQREEMERQRREMEQRRLYHQQQEEQQQQRQLEQQRRQQLELEHQQQQQQQQQLELERQQQQQQQYQQPPAQVSQRAHAPQYNYDYPPAVVHQTIPNQHRVPSHSRSGSGQHQAYPQQERVDQPIQQQHSMYPVPPEYRSAQPPQSHSQFVVGSNYAGNEPPSYSGHRRTVPTPAHQVAGYQLAEVSQQQYTSPQYHQQQRQETYQSWAPPDAAAYGSIDQATQPHGYATPYQQYTPDGAMRGMAADDTSLQETWQTYMYKVGSPRHLLED
ncbi:hypothetical protein H0H92_002782 [Tricholoma furcatifolium]|nr:hypothetical protein H0H92_002782 [Tricholoma furcatifolium]